MSRAIHISNLERTIANMQETIKLHKTFVANCETKLEARRAELAYQRILLKFDKIDGLRQHIADTIAEEKAKDNYAKSNS